jgi:ABC-type dipeptide/oligopeptide/nickel transport system permease component
MIPTLTIASIRLGALLGGTVVIETVFAWPGIEMLVLKHPPGITRWFRRCSDAFFFFILINLTVDILYKWLDQGSNWK